MEIIILVVALAVGIVLGILYSKVHLKKDGRAELIELNRKIAELEVEKKHFEARLLAQQNFLDGAKSEFKNLASSVLLENSKHFSDQTKSNLDSLLTPLKDQIVTFEKKVEATYSTEAKERHALKSEVGRLIELNDRMTKETTSLTQALRGDSKFQGDWGEFVLENILEASGLREGHEYSSQESHVNESGDRFRPDIRVNMPDSKHITVDSKVSLKSYDLYLRAEDDKTRALALKEHLNSFDDHINDLSKKHYPKLKGINSPEFVFMFVPIEPAYLLAMQNDVELSSRAWKKGIAIVTATTLLTSLKTVAYLWKIENQNRNAMEIAAEGAKLYDKFVGFVEDFEKVGALFETGQKLYSSAMSKLKNGAGNVFKKIERLRELGAAPTKQIKAELLD